MNVTEKNSIYKYQKHTVDRDCFCKDTQTRRAGFRRKHTDADQSLCKDVCTFNNHFYSIGLFYWFVGWVTQSPHPPHYINTMHKNRFTALAPKCNFLFLCCYQQSCLYHCPVSPVSDIIIMHNITMYCYIHYIQLCLSLY